MVIKVGILVLSALFFASCNVNEYRQLEAKRDSILNEYSFDRNQFQAGNLELLTGNGELGGLVKLNGLGFDSIWSSDLWMNKESRIPVQGVRIFLEGMEVDSSTVVDYRQRQLLTDGKVVTKVKLQNGIEYETDVFYSAQTKRLLVLKFKNLSSEQSINGTIRLPRTKYKYISSWPEYEMASSEADMFNIEKVNEYEVRGVSSDSLYTPGAWYFKSSEILRETSESNNYDFELAPGEESYFYWSFITEWETPEYISKSKEVVINEGDIKGAVDAHTTVWKNDWDLTPLLILPDREHEKLFYQSVFWLFCTSGSEQFLPGESQFAGTCWNMKPFTYGAAGWSTLAFMHLGHFEKAKKMLINHYKPEGLKENAKLYITDEQKGKLAFSFAHEAQTDGTTTKTCDEQRHLNGFALALFQKYYVLTGDDVFLNDYLFPVAKGVAEFWTDLAQWDEEVNGYIFPKLRSVSEDLFEKSLLDIVLSAKWSLETAIHYADKRKVDPKLIDRWKEVLNKMHIPQNNSYYLEFLNDNEERDYASYQGVRAPVYLGYPTSELLFTLDENKARNTLEHAWNRNHEGQGMLGFIASWYSLSAQSYGLGDLAKEMAAQNFNCFDPTYTALCEGPDNLDRYYFLTNTSSYLLFPLNMFVQSFENEIVSLPAVPSSWKNVEFYNIPASNRHNVSGMITKGQTQWYQVEKGNKLVHKTLKSESILLNPN